RIFVLRAPIHEDKASRSRALAPCSDAGKGRGIPQDVHRRLRRSAPGGHVDRFPGGPPPCAQRARRVRGPLPLSVQYRLGLLAFGISCDDRRRREPRGDFARPVLRRVDVLEPLHGDAALSSAPLELRPYYEDPFLGLRPIGSLALSLATVYFGFIALFMLSLLTSSSTPSIGDVVGVGGFLFGLILFGLFLFFLPLSKLHGRMI